MRYTADLGTCGYCLDFYTQDKDYNGEGFPSVVPDFERCNCSYPHSNACMHCLYIHGELVWKENELCNDCYLPDNGQVRWQKEHALKCVTCDKCYVEHCDCQVIKKCKHCDGTGSHCAVCAMCMKCCMCATNMEYHLDEGNYIYSDYYDMYKSVIFHK